MWPITATLLLLTLAVILWHTGTGNAATVTVTHQGIGSGLVTDGGGNCGDTCTFAVDSGGSLSLTFTPDDSGADLLGWGGMCAQYERNYTCTVKVDSANDRRFGGAYPVVYVTGYWQNGVCRGAKPIGGMLYFNSLQDAWNAAQAGTITARIECNNSFQQLNPTGSTTVTLSGGWGNFTPNTLPEAGETTLVAGTLTIASAPLIIGGDTVNGNGGITIVGGWRTMTGPVVITDTPLVIPEGPYDLGVIIK